MARETTPIAITMGDPAGVGPELCLRALVAPEVADCRPVVFGDAGLLARVAQAARVPGPPAVCTLAEWRACPVSERPLVVDCAAIAPEAVAPGQVSAACGRAAYTYIETAIAEALAGRVAGVATAPINKESLHRAGVPYPGHTEIFAALTGTLRYCMMLTSEEITVSFATTHAAIAKVSERLTTERVLEVITLTAEAMARLRGRPPVIGVCGLNPHAGEDGLFGDEEGRVIVPAIAQARALGLQVEGPLPPDAAFLPARRERTDAYVAMYHDQGHIPFKLLAFDTGVNVTLGLPIVRTSVDHGTAFDIAWQGLARVNSLLEAIRTAARLAEGRP